MINPSRQINKFVPAKSRYIKLKALGNREGKDDTGDAEAGAVTKLISILNLITNNNRVI